MNEPKTEKSKQTRQEIMEAARILFEKQGVIKTSVSEIVKKAGVAKGTFYLYFETKDDVVYALVEENVFHFEGLLKSLPGLPVTPQITEAFIDKFMIGLKHHARTLRMMHEIRFLNYLENTFKTDLIDVFIEDIKAWLDKGVAQGIIKIPSTRFFAQYIYQSFHEMIDTAITQANQYSFDELGSYLKLIFKRLIFSE